MLTKTLKMISILSAATWLLSGCALTTTTSPGTVPLTVNTSAAGTVTLSTAIQTTSALTSAPATTALTTAAETTAPGTTGGTAAGTATPITTGPTTTPAEATTPGTTAAPTKPAQTKNPIDPSDIKTGNAYDTATVRDWMWNNEAADYYPDQKLVFLTFDDGPSAGVTPKILDVLEANNVNGTFFYYTNGDLSGRADLIRRTVNNGNVIAIHTNSHNYSQLYPRRKADVEAIIADAQTALAKIRTILGQDWTTGVYRFPGGSFSWTGTKSGRAAMNEAKDALSDIGLEYLDWNALSGDADLNNRDKSASGLVKYTIKTTKNAAGHVIVLLMHDAGHITNGPKALQGIIDYYKEAGYEFGVLK